LTNTKKKKKKAQTPPLPMNRGCLDASFSSRVTFLVASLAHQMTKLADIQLNVKECGKSLGHQIGILTDWPKHRVRDRREKERVSRQKDANPASLLVRRVLTTHRFYR
jgi:hypothetical protein